MTADINPLNTIRGPANLWIAPFGTTEPAATQAALVQDPSVANVAWTFLGATQGGVSWIDDQTIEDTEADQVPDPIGGALVKVRTTVAFSMLEVTLPNLFVALNRMGTVSVGTGITTYTPGQANAATIPTYSAIIADGQAPQIAGGGQARRRGIFRKLLNNAGKITIAYDPSKNGLLAVTMQCYRVSGTIDRYAIQDQTA